MPYRIDILLKGGFVLLWDGRFYVEEGFGIAINGETIAEVGPSLELERKYQAQTVIEATNHFIIPGLINTHVHLESSLCRGLLDDLESVVKWVRSYFEGYYSLMDEETYYLASLLSCVCMLKTGTTTFCDAGTLPGLEASAVRAVNETGLRAILARIMMDIYDHGTFEGMPGRFKETTDQALTRGEAFLKNYGNGEAGLITTWLDLHQVPNCSDQLCKGTRDLCEKLGRGVVSHVSVSSQAVKMTVKRFGAPDIVRFDKLGLLAPSFIAGHANSLTGKELMLLLKRGAHVAHMPSASLHNAAGRIARGLIPEMRSMGINVCLGTDAAACSNFMDMVREMYLAAGVFKEVRADPLALTAEDALEMATVCGARALGLENCIGSISPGKKADIVTFSLLHPDWVPFFKENLIANLVYSATGNSVTTVIVNGKILMEKGRLTALDEEETLDRCQKAFAKVLKTPWWRQFNG